MPERMVFSIRGMFPAVPEPQPLYGGNVDIFVLGSMGG